MDSNKTWLAGNAVLRQKAEEMMGWGAADAPDNLLSSAPDASQQMVHELRVHQIELELQNEELRRAQIELDAARARYFDLYDLAPVGYCTVSEKGIIEEANLTAATMLGVVRGRLVGQPMSRFVMAEDQCLYYRHRKKLFETGRLQECRLRMLRTSGLPFWVRLEAIVAGEHECGAPVLRVVLIDISESMRTEAALAESELKYRTLADSGQALIWTSCPDRQCNYFNQPWFDFTGRTLEQERGEGWIRGVHPEDRERLLQTYAQAFEKREKFSIEYRLLHAGGDYRWIQDDGTPRFGAQGDFLGYIGHCLDITARKQAEAEQERLQGQLTQAQKMESVGRLAGGVAHDFNNMLSIIHTHVEIVQEELGSEHPLFVDLEQIRFAAVRSAALTRQLLAFARKQVVAPEVLDLNRTMGRMLRMLQRLIGEDINLDWRPGAGLWRVKIDPSQLDQILANLCVNARDAISGVGKVTVATENVVFDAEHCAPHPYFMPGEYVLLMVSDDGCGIDQETMAKLFEPFFTTKEIGKGTGLGLATVYGIVKQNNGFINVSSEPGRGATFNVYLPRQNVEEELLSPTVPAESAVCGNETILLVEDESAILDMGTRVLRRKGYTVLAAETPQGAIALAEKHGGEIHLLLTDVIMPEMNGRDLAGQLLKLHPNLKRLFMSGYSADVIAPHGVLDPGVNFLQKPFSRKDLVRKVCEVLGQEA
jgi:PAS domain S-box-containing protein